MTKTILFDLDNTLILFDEVKFFKAYIKKTVLSIPVIHENAL